MTFFSFTLFQQSFPLIIYLIGIQKNKIFISGRLGGIVSVVHMNCNTKKNDAYEESTTEIRISLIKKRDN